MLGIAAARLIFVKSSADSCEDALSARRLYAAKQSSFPKLGEAGYEPKNHSSGKQVAAQSTIVYADLCASAAQQPSAIAGSIASAARDGAMTGRFDIELRGLSADDVRSAIDEYPSGHDRLSQDRDLILLDTGAMLAFAPYRSRIVLSGDPFEHLDRVSETLSVGVDQLRGRVHEALLSAREVIALGKVSFDAVAPFLSREPELQAIPATPLPSANGAANPLLVVSHEDEQALQQTVARLAEAFPAEHFVAFSEETVFERGWKAVIHLGIAYSNVPGARLCDAWSGGVPVFQLVNPLALAALRRRRLGQTTGFAVEHGRTGLLSPSLEELVATVGELLVDPLPARAVARTARRRIDAPAEWDVLVNSVLR